MKIGLLGPRVPGPTAYGVSETMWGTKIGLEYHGHEVVVGDIAADVDVWYCYTVGALSYVKDRTEPKVCALVDLDHHVDLYRRQYFFRQQPMTYAEIGNRHKMAMERKLVTLDALQNVALVIEHAKHHSDWLNEQGVKSCYVPMPIVDPGQTGNFSTFSSSGFRILMAGHLMGIATLSGLYFLEENILPILESKLKPGSFTIHVCGKDELPKALKLRFNMYHPEVIFRGYVDDISAEFHSADIVLVPTPIDLGLRTRIVDAFAHGCLVVAHEANGAGMPEMRHGDNALTGRDPQHLVDGISATMHATLPEKMAIRQRARQTFVEHFEAKVSMAPVAKMLEAIVG